MFGKKNIFTYMYEKRTTIFKAIFYNFLLSIFKTIFAIMFLEHEVSNTTFMNNSMLRPVPLLITQYQTATSQQ